MLDVLTKILGLVACFYVVRGLLGKSRDGDWTKLLLALAVFLALVFLRPSVA